MTVSPFLENAAIAFSAVTGVLAARTRGLDLFGALVLAIVTAFGGGTVRDLLAGDTPVAWLRDPSLLYIAGISAVLFFFIMRIWEPPSRLLDLGDACSLALFNVIGASKGIMLGFDASVAVMFGVITGVAGGILRDVLTSQIPIVFRRDTYFYATAAAAGGTVYAVLMRWNLTGAVPAEISGIVVCLLMRLAALRWRLALPGFREKP